MWLQVEFGLVLGIPIVSGFLCCILGVAVVSWYLFAETYESCHHILFHFSVIRVQCISEPEIAVATARSLSFDSAGFWFAKHQVWEWNLFAADLFIEFKSSWNLLDQSVMPWLLFWYFRLTLLLNCQIWSWISLKVFIIHLHSFIIHLYKSTFLAFLAVLLAIGYYYLRLLIDCLSVT